MSVKLYKLSSMMLLLGIVTLSACAAQPASTPTFTPQPTNTIVPTPFPTPENPFPGLKEWDLLIMGPSNLNGEVYARLIAMDQNVKVNLINCFFGSIRTLLDFLEKDYTGAEMGQEDATCQGSLVDYVKQAEVMVLTGDPLDSGPSDGSWNVGPTHANCVSGDFTGYNQDAEKLKAFNDSVLNSCQPDKFTNFKKDFELVLNNILEIRAGNPLILRLTDSYIPAHKAWREAGVDEVCTTCLSNFSDAITAVAEKYGVLNVSELHAYNGIDHMADPADKGWVGSDGIHLTSEGFDLFAKILQQSGYGHLLKK